MGEGEGLPVYARDVAQATADGEMRFSICTLVTRPAEYREMASSFIAKGFSTADCEYLVLDNSRSNQMDAFEGYNLFLSHAVGDYIILCHQDILLHADDRADLEARLAELCESEPNWAICGNAGGIAFGSLAIRISDPHGEDQRSGKFPSRVTALDENFLVVRRAANLALSRDLSGFHFYGADLCIVADFLGWDACVIDFHLRHKSGGSADAGYYALRAAAVRKYSRSMRPRWVETTVTRFFVSGSTTLSTILTAIAVRIPRRVAALLYRRTRT